MGYYRKQHIYIRSCLDFSAYIRKFFDMYKNIFAYSFDAANWILILWRNASMCPWQKKRGSAKSHYTKKKSNNLKIFFQILIAYFLCYLLSKHISLSASLRAHCCIVCLFVICLCKHPSVYVAALLKGSWDQLTLIFFNILLFIKNKLKALERN